MTQTITRRNGHSTAVGIVLALLLAAGVVVIPITAMSAAPSECAALSAGVYSRYSPSLSTGLLTLSYSEAANAASRYGFTGDRGIPFQAAATDQAGLTEVRRLYSGARGDFQWLADPGDIDTALAQGYQLRKVEFYALAAPAADGCSTPVYRMARGNKHQFVTPGPDQTALEADGWSNTGAAFHVLSTDSPEPTPTASASPTATTSSTPTATPTNPPSGDLRVTDVASTGPDSDTTFTIAVMPDTQREVTVSSDLRGERRAEWLIANRDSRDIRVVLSVGDSVNWDTADHEQYEKASATVRMLEGAALSWLPTIGNHDTAAVCPGGAACPGGDTRAALRQTQTYNDYFPTTRFPWLQGAQTAGKVDNTYSAFRAGGVDWLVVSLEMWPRQEMIDWANAVVAANPDFNVIVQTHMYVDDLGEIATDDGGYGATTPRFLYDTFISQHPNIKIVVGGHRGYTTTNRLDSPNGNPVASWNNAWHSDSTNPVMLLTIDTAAGSVDSATYAPDTDEWFPRGRGVLPEHAVGWLPRRPDSDSHGYRHPVADAHPDADGDGHGDGNSHRHSDCDANADQHIARREQVRRAVGGRVLPVLAVAEHRPADPLRQRGSQRRQPVRLHRRPRHPLPGRRHRPGRPHRGPPPLQRRPRRLPMARRPRRHRHRPRPGLPAAQGRVLRPGRPGRRRLLHARLPHGPRQQAPVRHPRPRSDRPGSRRLEQHRRRLPRPQHRLTLSDSLRLSDPVASDSVPGDEG